MPDLTTKDALLEKMVEQTGILKENIQNMMTVLTPVGVIQAFAGSATPDGWLLCDGSAVSRTDYADLYAVIGDTYGAGDGVDTFNLPDLVDQFVQGSATSGTVKSAGLPNITGSFSVFIPVSSSGSVSKSGFSAGDGAFSRSNPQSSKYFTAAGDTSMYNDMNFDASTSDSIYGNSTTVQPPALTMRYIIKC